MTTRREFISFIAKVGIPGTAFALYGCSTPKESTQTLATATKIATQLPKKPEEPKLIPTLADVWRQDPATGLEAQFNADGEALAYKRPSGELMPSFMADQSWTKFGLEKTKDGGWRLKTRFKNEYHFSSFDGPEVVEKWLTKQSLPKTFRDESNSFPEEGTLGLVDKATGDIYVFYDSNNKRMYAGFQQELPGNMIIEQEGAITERFDVHFMSVEADRAASGYPDSFIALRNQWNYWIVKARGGNHSLTLEQYNAEVAKGIKHNVNVWLSDPKTGAKKRYQINEDTIIRIKPKLIQLDKQNSFDVPELPGDTMVGQYGHAGFKLGQYSIDGGKEILIEQVRTPDTVSTGTDMLYGDYMIFNVYGMGTLAASDSWQKDGKPDWIYNETDEYGDIMGMLEAKNLNVNGVVLGQNVISLIEPDVRAVPAK